MNTFFQFKQFTIHQEKCAMKVCTDACLFGAWVADKIEKKDINPLRILDIGTGTGLLSLMLAQKSDCAIDAVELNKEAFEQAKENMEQSPWSNKAKVFNADITCFKAKEKYDFIICNPPFFENQLKTDNENRNAAMHATTLSFEALLKAIKNNLTENGTAALLLPYDKITFFEKKLGPIPFFIEQRLNVKHAPTHPLFRSMIIISAKEEPVKENELSIKNNDGSYSNEFIKLLATYYLHF